MTDVGTILRVARAAAGCSQTELAHRVGVQRTRLSEWERGHCRPRPDVAVRLLAALVATPSLVKGARSRC